MCVTKDSVIVIWILVEFEDDIPAAFGVLLSTSPLLIYI